ncbi:MAG TPA: SIMPL domain-containing protein [Bacteroidia bacterium]|nr:SIMPL domain-containing protein [Bacteroidia bacterium]
MKKLLTLLLIVAGTIVANGQSQSNYYYNKDIQNQPVDSDWPCGDRGFTASSDVMIYVPPDAWILELHGMEEAPTLESARSKLQVRINAFQKKLNTLGIPNTDITITTVSQEKVSGWKTNEKGINVWTVTGYSLTKSLLIRYTESNKYNQIISAAAEQSLDNVQQHYCTVADEQAVYAELYRQAMDVCMQKREEEATFNNAIIAPNWTVVSEYYDVQTPSPGVYVPPGAGREVVTGYDRVINPEYGASAVKYIIHLEISYTLTKPQRNNSPVRNK